MIASGKSWTSGGGATSPAGRQQVILPENAALLEEQGGGPQHSRLGGQRLHSAGQHCRPLVEPHSEGTQLGQRPLGSRPGALPVPLNRSPGTSAIGDNTKEAELSHGAER